ncbi:hypothetical protein ACEE86_23490, partial [Proteus mirabilis]
SAPRSVVKNREIKGPIMRHNFSGGKMKQRQFQFVVKLLTLTIRKVSLFSKKLFFKTPLIDWFFLGCRKTHIAPFIVSSKENSND